MNKFDKIQEKLDGNISTEDECKFTLKCECCGSSNVRLIPTHHYEDGNLERPQMITMSMRCACGNRFEYIIDKN